MGKHACGVCGSGFWYGSRTVGKILRVGGSNKLLIRLYYVCYVYYNKRLEKGSHLGLILYASYVPLDLHASKCENRLFPPRSSLSLIFTVDGSSDVPEAYSSLTSSPSFFVSQIFFEPVIREPLWDLASLFQAINLGNQLLILNICIYTPLAWSVRLLRTILCYHWFCIGC